jgi:hypothetical protein
VASNALPIDSGTCGPARILPCADHGIFAPAVFCRSPAQVGALGPVKVATFPLASMIATCRPSLPGKVSSSSSRLRTSLALRPSRSRTSAFGPYPTLTLAWVATAPGARLGPRHDRADREVSRRDGDAPVARGGIVGERWRRSRRSPARGRTWRRAGMQRVA